MKVLLVSLIHNRKDLVGEAIMSAVNQTLPKTEWKHLLIDNASTDGADLVAEGFANKHSHIYLHKSNTNMHQMPAYNWALKWAGENYPEAEIMAQLDSDDKLLPIALEEAVKTFIMHPEIGQAYSGFNIINKRGDIKVKDHPKAKMVSNQFTPEGQRALRKMFVKTNPCGHLRTLRIKCLKDIGGFDETYKYATDYNMAGRMLTKYPVIKIPKVLYNWRQHDTQVERQHSPEQTKHWQLLQKHYTELWKKMGLI